MSRLQASIRTSLVRLQKRRVEFYLKSAEQFTSNYVIRNMWLGIAGHLEQHTSALKALPLSSWNFLDDGDAGSILTAISQAPGSIQGTQRSQTPLHQQFARALDLEEPIMTKVYAPIVRALRANWTERASELYVMARCLLTQLARLIEPFCGDPSLNRRCALLAQGFEQELNRQQAPFKKTASKAGGGGRESKAYARPARVDRMRRSERKAPRSQRTIGIRPKRLVKRPKPLLRSIKLSRRRARG